MSPENKRALLNVAADLRKIITRGVSHEWQLRGMAVTISDVVREEGEEDVRTIKIKRCKKG